MPLAALATLDDFDRADGGLGSNWASVLGNLQIVSNQATGPNGSEGIEQWDVEQFGADQGAFVQIVTKGGNAEQTALLVRFDDVNVDGYQINMFPAAGTDTIEVVRVDGGTPTQLGATINQEFSNGDWLGLTAIGDTIRVYRSTDGNSWTELGRRTDSTYSGGGYIGLGQGDDNAALDNFGGGTLQNVTVSASPGVVTSAGIQATIDATTTVVASPGVVQAVGNQATVSTAVAVQAATGVVQVVGNQATVITTVVVVASPGVVNVVGVGATIVAGNITVEAATGVVQVVGVPVFVDTVRYLLDLEVSDAVVYSVELGDGVVYDVALGDVAPYSVELEDASRS